MFTSASRTPTVGVDESSGLELEIGDSFSVSKVDNLSQYFPGRRRGCISLSGLGVLWVALKFRGEKAGCSGLGGRDVRQIRSAFTKSAARKSSSWKQSRSASPDRGRRVSATPMSRSISSTSISAPANIRCNCPMASVRMRLALLKRISPGVTDIRVGDRVGYLIGPQGAYAERPYHAGGRAASLA